MSLIVWNPQDQSARHKPFLQNYAAVASIKTRFKYAVGACSCGCYLGRLCGLLEGGRYKATRATSVASISDAPWPVDVIGAICSVSQVPPKKPPPPPPRPPPIAPRPAPGDPKRFLVEEVLQAIVGDEESVEARGHPQTYCGIEPNG